MTEDTFFALGRAAKIAILSALFLPGVGSLIASFVYGSFFLGFVGIGLCYVGLRLLSREWARHG